MPKSSPSPFPPPLRDDEQADQADELAAEHAAPAPAATERRIGFLYGRQATASSPAAAWGLSVPVRTLETFLVGAVAGALACDLLSSPPAAPPAAPRRRRR